ncbi:MAG: hypothetical protein PHT59_01570 [Candidatus Omnitrophica bacterium]|nr:hypothetical protein [Candidatus Omnitrophota bacterium]
MAGKRPKDLAVIAVIVMLLGMYTFLDFIFSIGYYGSIFRMGAGKLIQVLSVHILMLFTAAGIGVYLQRERARLFTVIIGGYSVGFSIYEYGFKHARLLGWELTQPDFWLQVVLPFFTSIFLVQYLTRPGVREWFKEPNEASR